MAAETGCIIQSEERDTQSAVKKVYSASAGMTVGNVFHDFVANYNWAAILSGTTGLPSAQPGVAITLANSFGVGANANGVSSGGIYCLTSKISHQAEDLRMVSGTAEQRPGIA